MFIQTWIQSTCRFSATTTACSRHHEGLKRFPSLISATLLFTRNCANYAVYVSVHVTPSRTAELSLSSLSEVRSLHFWERTSSGAPGQLRRSSEFLVISTWGNARGSAQEMLIFRQPRYWHPGCTISSLYPLAGSLTFYSRTRASEHALIKAPCFLGVFREKGRKKKRRESALPRPPRWRFRFPPLSLSLNDGDRSFASTRCKARAFLIARPSLFATARARVHRARLLINAPPNSVEGARARA